MEIDMETCALDPYESIYIIYIKRIQLCLKNWIWNQLGPVIEHMCTGVSAGFEPLGRDLKTRTCCNAGIRMSCGRTLILILFFRAPRPYARAVDSPVREKKMRVLLSEFSMVVNMKFLL